MAISDSAQMRIEQLQLRPHPEGGWYRETWRAEAGDDGRARGTAILFLLAAGERSHWHRVDADELWFWQAGDPLELAVAADGNSPPTALILGADVAAGQQLQGVVPAHAWQAARPAPPDAEGDGFTLVSCIVVPGFDFTRFELAPADWEPGQ